METSEQLINLAKDIFPGSNNGNPTSDLIMSKAVGSKIWDIHGNEYIDYLLGSGPMLIGHSHPKVVEAVSNQLSSGSTFFALNELAVKLGQEIIDAVPCAEQIRYFTSGTEATLYAMRAARAFTGKEKILKFEGGYHGMHDYSLMSLMPKVEVEYPVPSIDSAGIPESIKNEMLIAPFNDFETTESLITEFKEEIAGVIIEPFQRVIKPKPGFLESVRDITNKYKIPLIFDEIVTGFRFGYGGAQEYYNVVPDLCTLGKVVAGGYPMAAIVGKKNLMEVFNQKSDAISPSLVQIGTLSGNPIACAAGLATLEVLKTENPYEKLFETGYFLQNTLKEIFNRHEIPAQVVGEGPVFDVYFCSNEISNYRDTMKANKSILNSLNSNLIDSGIFKGDTKYYVSTVHDSGDVEKTISAFETAVFKLKGQHDI